MVEQQYAVVPTREGLEGVKDKAAIMNALAKRVAEYDREFVNTVREVVNPAGNNSEQQVRAWTAHVKSLTYHREYGEIFSHPRETLANGGDCDDLTLLALAGLHALSIPCCPDIVTRKGDGVHVRARIGLPPTNPPKDLAEWLVFDPVEQSEKEWAMLPEGTPTPLLGDSIGIAEQQAVFTGMAGDGGTAAAAYLSKKSGAASGSAGLGLLAMLAFGGVVWYFASKKSPQGI